MSRASSPGLLTLHAVRLLGFAPTGTVAARFRLDEGEVADRLEDARSAGLATWSEFIDLSGWSLTVAGRAADEDALAAELDAAGARPLLERAHAAFEPLNAVVTSALTAAQLDPGTVLDEPVRRDLAAAADGWGALESHLADVLPRLGGYRARFLTALFRADDDPTWLAGTSVDSCHRVWFELHEDLLSTLGLPR